MCVLLCLFISYFYWLRERLKCRWVPRIKNLKYFCVYCRFCVLNLFGLVYKSLLTGIYFKIKETCACLSNVSFQFPSIFSFAILNSSQRFCFCSPLVLFVCTLASGTLVSACANDSPDHFWKAGFSAWYIALAHPWWLSDLWEILCLLHRQLWKMDFRFPCSLGEDS